MDGGSSSSGSRARTCDPLINSQLLCQLSYPGSAIANTTAWTTADKRQRPPLSLRVVGPHISRQPRPADPRKPQRASPPGLRQRKPTLRSALGHTCLKLIRQSECRNERVTGNHIRAGCFHVGDNLAVVRDDNDGHLVRNAPDLSTDHIIGSDPLGREDNAHMTSARRVSADDGRTVKHDRDLCSVTPSNILGPIDQRVPLIFETPVWPPELRNVIPINEISARQQQRGDERPLRTWRSHPRAVQRRFVAILSALARPVLTPSRRL